MTMATNKAFTALVSLHDASISSSNPKVDRRTALSALGYIPRRTKAKPTRDQLEKTTEFHKSIRQEFTSSNSSADARDKDIMKFFQNQENLPLLCALGYQKRTLLHKLCIFSEDSTERAPEDLKLLKPLIRFLLTIDPDFPKYLDDNQQVPLYLVLTSALKPDIKSEIVHFFCSNREGCLNSTSAIESLGMTGMNGYFVGRNPESQPDVNSSISHCLHKAIDDNVLLDEGILKSGILKECLKLLDSEGLTCLHKALDAPETNTKREWAERLVGIDNTLLATRNHDGLTPLQYLVKNKRDEENESDGNERKQDQKSSTDSQKAAQQQKQESQLEKPEMEMWLKICCLTSICFTNSQAREIMYEPHMMQHTDFNSLEEGDVVSTKSLENSNKHFKLDKLLRIVYIPRVTVDWDFYEDKKKSSGLDDCLGRTDYCLIFWWLRDAVKVNGVLNVVVDDMEPVGSATISHSDEAIVHCLQGLQVRSWNWKRLDISSEVICRAAPAVEEVYLYCSGNNAILRSWSDTQGLALLKKLRTVNLEVYQGLESRAILDSHIVHFKETLEARFKERHALHITVRVTSASESSSHNEQLAKAKEEGEDGYQEQEWLHCMDNFADFVHEICDEKGKKVTVALIDDGVKSRYENLDDNIDGGESWVIQSNLQEPQSPYLTSIRGHGTIMAYLVRRVCPEARLYVLKLDPVKKQSSITFSIESATKAIEWAIKKKVDIICMSWAIDEIQKHDNKEDKRVTALKKAVRQAAETENILLFCAWPDKGAGVKNTTYPRSLSDKIFAIAAGTNEGRLSPQAGDGEPDLVLPGVELAIPMGLNKQGTGVARKYNYHTGSSLSCALATGLAAMLLYCTRQARPEHADSLKQYKNMKEVFESLRSNKVGWIAAPVHFGQPLKNLKSTDREDMFKKIVDKFLGRMEPTTKLNNDNMWKKGAH
ncbi:subtilisin-like protein [Xylaria telfairii]|nr:subtilisin-like protein [Xylaria telfairii]